MKILVDENMPYAERLFSRLGEVRAVSGRPVPPDALNDADALMVRSVTKVNAELLAGTPVRFVGTATAGTDHVDEEWLAQQGIGFSAAPGCNAIAVVEYVFSALMLLAERDGFDLREKTVGIVGVGNVGGRLDQRLRALGVKTLLCDPPRAERGDDGAFYPLETLVKDADVLTFHTPLNKSGPYQSLHLADAELLAALPDNRILINASRGPVVDNAALLQALEGGKTLSAVLDVWEPEPALSLPLLARADIGTPHIAGYSLEGKARGTTQVFEAFGAFLGEPAQASLSELLPPPEMASVRLRGKLNQDVLKRLIHLVYDVRRDDAPLRRVAGEAGGFDRLRKHYPERREWSSLNVVCDDGETAALLTALGFSASAA
ncbi:4-phosphoerythronate dehydrogenase PdxB [Enterobacillus tribolii]|uniref:Erythronate-4-phosphate dehydrogenase n=1 Tax=Enterobacillus tribolii TaxID=1487935 RepID=A0A370QM40_9GAMM|nr:4-phosphoerythronate dehydrogenase PdxB [Enterobacillus tribolii]MBW7982266.1 4-phosphoerythronate dehydrogenase PdxB [Enterobacillus tribolii]RDK89436.1 4-phosphoerythronate dehydrogenase [Enterobacillus tribolii]